MVGNCYDLELSWAEAKPRQTGAAYRSRASAVAPVTSCNDGVGRSCDWRIRIALSDVAQEPRTSVMCLSTLRSSHIVNTEIASSLVTPSMGALGLHQVLRL